MRLGQVSKARAVWGSLLCWLWWWPIVAWGQASVIERSWWLDTSGGMTLSAVQSQDWRPAPELLSLGYSPHALWVRLRVQVASTEQPVVLRMQPSYLDDVRLYVPDPVAPPQWLMRQTGDRQPFEARDRASSALSFVWQPQAAGEHTLYLRVQTTSSLLFNVALLDGQAAQFQDDLRDVLMVCYLGIMLCMVLWGVVDYLLHRAHVNLWFVATQLNSMVVAMSVLGYWPRLLPAAWAMAGHDITGVSVCLSTMLYVGFYRSMLADNAPSCMARWAATLTMSVFVAQIGALASGHHQWAVASNAFVTVFVAVPVFWWMVYTTQKDGLLSRRAWYWVGLLQGLLSSMVMLPLLGLPQLSVFNMHATLFVGLSSACLMLVVLMRRSARTMQEAHAARLRLDLLSQRLTLEQQHRQEQRQFLDMLGHELKTPLMTIRLAVHGLMNSDAAQQNDGVQRRLQRIDASSLSMGQVLDRVLEANREDQTSLSVKKQRVDLSDLMTSIKAGLPEGGRIEFSGAQNVMLESDPEQLQVVLSNLFDNACKYSPAASRIQVRVAVESAMCQIAVRNALGSVKVPDATKIFQKYHRAEEVKNLPGAGIGLWLSHQIASRLGGSLTLQQVDEDVEFCFCLPLTSAPLARQG